MNWGGGYLIKAYTPPLRVPIDSQGTWLLVDSNGAIQWSIKEGNVETADFLARRLGL
jgi:hypothetical protein